jgi:hypothetical protein
MTAIRRNRILVWLAVGAGLLLFAAANAHLIAVAFESQPECVDHVKLGDSKDGAYSAAKSWC